MLGTDFIGIAVFVAIAYVVYRLISKDKKKDDAGPITGGPLPPDPVEDRENNDSTK